MASGEERWTALGDDGRLADDLRLPPAKTYLTFSRPT